ncbi:hypothetical protein LUZ60_007150 [Juncus effusus]|nr:hypothetical protein LUZ60_007150 [Juncus effusus]
MQLKTIKFITRNVRGLNKDTKRGQVRDNLLAERPDFVCLQETKLKEYTPQIHRSIVGSRLRSYVTLDSLGASGGILMAWNDNLFNLVSCSKQREELHEIIGTSEISEGLGDFSASFIALIPKKEGAIWAKDYRPISLISSVQKIISKTLANRLKTVISELILPNQLGFIEGREISDCFFYAREAIHTAHASNKPFHGSEGFGERWINWVKYWVLGGVAKVLLNGTPGKNIHLKRGVRQGDPLSPHLFILAIDTLSRVAESFGRVNFIERPLGKTHISLFYADDSLFLIKPDIVQVRRLKLLLNSFGGSSGLSINYDKSEFTVIPDTTQEIVVIAQELGCPHVQLPFTYLEYPFHYKKPTADFYRTLIEKFEQRLQGWKGTLLSSGGRLTLINVVLTSLPVYHLTVFKFPKWVIQEMDRIREEGGLGVIDLETFNASLNMKWLWKFFGQKGGLDWQDLVSNVAEEGCDLKHSRKGSYFWRGLDEALKFFYNRAKFNVGKGDMTDLWFSNWGQGFLFEKFESLHSHFEYTGCSVAQFKLLPNRDEAFGWTDSDTVRQQFHHLQAMMNQLHATQEEDGIRWIWTESGNYTSQSAYKKLKLGVNSVSDLNTIWSIRLPKRIQIFLWLRRQRKILTIDNLQRRGRVMVNRWHLCLRDSGTVEHISGGCDFVQSIWVEKWRNGFTIQEGVRDGGRLGEFFYL